MVCHINDRSESDVFRRGGPSVVQGNDYGLSARLLGGPHRELVLDVQHLGGLTGRGR